ncbi:MAG: P1 family peptidase [Anaerovoracaceae bacterium]|jgi:L-aminopeptidase/D-esterase-like protein
MREVSRIRIQDIEGFRFGTAESLAGATGVTVIVSEEGAVAGVDVRGGGPATRETDVIKPENTVQTANAVVISGGSAFGLEAGCGVMDALAAREIGLDTGLGIVPIVCGASLFDLQLGEKGAYPDKAMGFTACENAFRGQFGDGCRGAGCGATVGKLMGSERCMKSGQGVSAAQLGDLKAGALTAVNCVGDVFDENGNALAGLLSEDGSHLISTEEALLADLNAGDMPLSNTTISCIVTNAKLDKARCAKLASVCHDAFARSIRPVHCSADGDTIFVLASGRVETDFDVLAVLAARQVQASITGAVSSADPKRSYGLKCAADFR